MTRISLEDVSKYFDGGETVANYELNLEVEDGEFLVFLGPSGCGKTTALRIVAGLEEPSKGEVFFDGESVTSRSPSDRNVAMVFQNYALYPHMTVRENVAYPLKIAGVAPEERDRRVEEVADLLHITDQLQSSPAELSGGQRQRTALARAIVREPSVFLLDEPLSNLDAKLRQEMRSELKRIQDDLDVTTVYVTHNQEEAMSMADRVVVMNEGTIRQVAQPQELYARPRTEWVARFIGSPPMNLIRGTSRNGSIDLGDAGSVAIDLSSVSSRAGGESSAPSSSSGAVDASSDVGDASGSAGDVSSSSGDVAGDTVSGGASDVSNGASDVSNGASDVSNGASDVSAGFVSSPTNVSLGVRPEDLSVHAERPDAGYAIQGTVDTVEPLGEYTLVNVTVADQTVIAKEPHTTVERGDAVFLAFDDADAYVYDENGELLPGP